MAIKTRVPDPTEEYNVQNQRSMVRAMNSVIGQINAQYKPEGDTFEQAQKLSYFLFSYRFLIIFKTGTVCVKTPGVS